MIERRFFPRYHFEMQLRLHGGEEQEFSVDANEISEAGLSFMIPLSILNSLAGSGHAMEIGNKFKISIPSDAQFEISIDCQIMHIRRLSQQHYLIGVWFGQLTDQEQAIIKRLVNNAKLNSDESL